MNFRVSVIVTLLLALLAVPVSAQDDDEATLGEVVTIEGEVHEILSPYSFVLRQTEPFDFTPSEIVVVNDDTQAFAIDVNVGRNVQVTGTVDSLNIDGILDQIEYSIETTLFDEYDTDDYTVVASLVTDPSTLAVAADFEYDPDIALDMSTDITPYLGQTFTVEGYVAEILGPYSFRLEQTEPFDLTPSSFIVVNDDTQPFAVDVNVGRHLRVTGPIYAFDPVTIEADIDYDLEDEVFVNYDAGDYSMIGEAVELVAARTPDTVYATTQLNTDVTMDMLEDNPFDYIGQIVTLQGEVEERYTDTSFLMEEDEFFDLDPMQIPVFAAEDINYPEEGMNLMDVIDDELYTVTGEIVAFNLLEIETQLGIGYDPALYVDFDEDNVAIIATSVSRTDG